MTVNNEQLVQQQMDALFSEIEYLIRLLYVTHDVQMKNLTLNQLWNKVEQLKFVTQLEQDTPNTQQTMTREQLAQYNGKNGKPAYVAVKGIVYDVTHNAAWSAATHFGLTAGNDVTREFASCHAAEQWILNTLTPVGRLTE
jgi:membrane-associated progesterone receptor component